MLATCADVLLKIGETHPPALILSAPLTFVSTILSFWVGLGIVMYIASLSLRISEPLEPAAVCSFPEALDQGTPVRAAA
jgi:hypothetical protein